MSMPQALTADLATLRRAIEQGEEDTLVGLYADDAQITVVDRSRPPSKPTVVAGKPAIAEQLVVSERTVESHVTNILGKLGFTVRSQIAAWAATRGLVASRRV